MKKDNIFSIGPHYTGGAVFTVDNYSTKHHGYNVNLVRSGGTKQRLAAFVDEEEAIQYAKYRHIMLLRHNSTDVADYLL